MRIMLSNETIKSYVINGGKKLKGEITVNTSKNSATAILVASLLNEGKTTIKNLPRIEEVFRIIEVLESMGVKTKWKPARQKGGGKSLEIIPPKNIEINKINKEAAEKTRSVIMFIGPLVHKFKKFYLPSCGGCKLGRRTIIPHLYALENFGIKINPVRNNKLEIYADLPNVNQISNGVKISREIIMYESGDTATENVIMAAALIPGRTVIKLASANYQVQDLCFFLKKLGVKIEGIGTTNLVIFGKKKINKNIEYYLTEDPVESILFLASAIVTKSSITIKRCPIEFLELELLKLKKMGFKFKISREYKARNGFGRLVDIKTFPSNLIAPIEKIYARPFPGLNIDNLPFFVSIATQVKGKTLIHDWVYENRAVYYTEINRLGAKITLADAHRVFIEGPTKLKGAEIMSPPALRPSAIILVAMLAAKGRSVLKNTYAIERGYEDLCGRLKKIGADIKKI